VRVDEIMTRDVVTVARDTPLKEVAAVLALKRISGVPVCADGRVVGVVSEADILRKEQGAVEPGRRVAWLLRSLDGELDKLTARTAGEAMTRSALTIGPSASVAEAARLMLGRRVNRLPIVDRGELVGIVTRADLVRAFGRPDHELVLDIRHDVAQRMLWIDDERLEVAVDGGVVTLCGRLDTRSDADLLVRCVRRVPGVVDVQAELAWDADDRARTHSSRLPRRV
jgi:CBS domain-containing protein